ncbi:MAG: FAD-dependent oxidoreductase [Ruminococcaceae bacterium]|nr:FAD-dependent oxidoreductase [Oscillospiraceae bacterium]
MKKYDVAVVGGGFAGTAAAIAAARGGANVLIIEKGNSLGGAAVNCLVNPFMRSWGFHDDGTRLYLSRGIFSEIVQNLMKIDGYVPYYKIFDEEKLKLVLFEMVEKENIDLLFHAYIFKTEIKDGLIQSAFAATVGGVEEIQADYFIDSTGDAQLAFLSDCPTRLGREPDNLCQPMTLCFRVGGVNVEKFYEEKEEMNRLYAEYLNRGEFINPRENILVFKTMHKDVLHFNTTRVVKKNPTSAFEVTEAELIARKQIYEVFDFMKKHASSMKDAYILSTAAEIGVRESRMIVGDYVLTENDCKALTVFEDRIAACNYDIDIHNPEGTGTSHYFFKGEDYYTIPYRSLIPKGVDNMLIAGRCISSDHGAQASYRIMPTVCSIGEAAGTAAALAAENKKAVREIDVKKLQDRLTASGAFIG